MKQRSPIASAFTDRRAAARSTAVSAYRIVGTTYDGVQVLAPKMKSKVWTPAQMRRAIRQAMKELRA